MNFLIREARWGGQTKWKQWKILSTNFLFVKYVDVIILRRENYSNQTCIISFSFNILTPDLIAIVIIYYERLILNWFISHYENIYSASNVILINCSITVWTEHKMCKREMEIKINFSFQRKVKFFVCELWNDTKRFWFCKRTNHENLWIEW